MRSTVAILIVLASTVPSAAQPGEQSNRARLVAALERLIVTGEPRDTAHDAGEWLQRQVDAAVARGDADINRLAHRAAAPVVVRLSAPLSSIRDLPALNIVTHQVLRVPRPSAYTSRLSVSVDGGDLIDVGTFASGKSLGATIRQFLPASALTPGPHHLRFRAQVTFAEDSRLAPETRDLPEIVYGLYDPDSSALDMRVLLQPAIDANVRALDSTLPDGRLDVWLHTVLQPRGGRLRCAGCLCPFGCGPYRFKAPILPRCLSCRISWVAAATRRPRISPSRRRTCESCDSEIA